MAATACTRESGSATRRMPASAQRAYTSGLVIEQAKAIIPCGSRTSVNAVAGLDSTVPRRGPEAAASTHVERQRRLRCADDVCGARLDSRRDSALLRHRLRG